MPRRYFFLLKIKIQACLIVAVTSIAFFFPSIAPADSSDIDIVKLIKPEPDSEIIDKRPEIVCEVTAFDTYESILILINGADVTGIINTTPEGFSFRPVEILTAGSHVLLIILTADDGTQVQQEFTFSTRHSELFEEVYSKNDLTVAYEKTSEKPDDARFQTSYKTESNLGSDTVIREKKWDMRFKTNLRYMNQNLAVYSPLEKGINLANYLLAGAYIGEQFQAYTEVGDVYVNETQNTVNLSRRGGTFAVNYNALKLKTFVVNTEEVFGFKDGTGIGGSSDEHIMGVSGQIGLFSDKIRLKTIYATGGEKGDSYSIYTAGGDKKGSVLGFQLSAGFFDNKLNAEAELDFSDYDADTTDEFSYEKDKAYKLGANGLWGDYSYGAIYEFVGTEYQVIGNPYLLGDREGVAVNFGTNYNIHSTTIALSKYNDNVDNDDLYPQTDTYQGQINYMFTKFSSLPISLTYQHSQIKSNDEPEYTPHMENTIDAISGMVNYLIESWNFGFQAGYSDQNDKTPQNYDTNAVNYTVSSNYFSEYISISPSMSFNRSRYQPTSVKTDTKIVTLDLRGNAWDQRITYECAGTFSRMESSDDTMKQDSYNTNFRIAYILAEKIWGLANPSAGFMGYYNTTEDYVYNTRSHNFTLLFVFSTSMPFVL